MESVHLNDDTTVSLAQYTSRRQLQLITCADFDTKLGEKGCSKEAKVCRLEKIILGETWSISVRMILKRLREA
jgi:hypothetical protein